MCMNRTYNTIFQDILNMKSIENNITKSILTKIIFTKLDNRLSKSITIYNNKFFIPINLLRIAKIIPTK